MDPVVESEATQWPLGSWVRKLQQVAEYESDNQSEDEKVFDGEGVGVTSAGSAQSHSPMPPWRRGKMGD